MSSLSAASAPADAAAALEAELRGEEQDDEVFGRFQLVEKLGEGTYGKVYQAVSKETGGMFALKKSASITRMKGFQGQPFGRCPY